MKIGPRIAEIIAIIWGLQLHRKLRLSKIQISCGTYSQLQMRSNANHVHIVQYSLIDLTNT